MKTDFLEALQRLIQTKKEKVEKRFARYEELLEAFHTCPNKEQAEAYFQRAQKHLEKIEDEQPELLRLSMIQERLAS